MRKVSVISAIICALTLLLIIVITKNYKEDNQIIESDAIHYYSYLPSLLVYNDLSQSFLDKDLGELSKYYWSNVKLPDGRHYFKTTMGVALMQSLFIVPIHFFVKWTGGEANGVSPIYKAGILFSALFYYFIGLLFLRNLLRKFKFKEAVIALTIIGIGLATNLAFYVFREPGMSHVYSFASIIIFASVLNNFYEYQSNKLALIAGLLAGLVVLVRPINIVIVFILVLSWDIDGIKKFKDRFYLFFNKPIYTTLFLLGAALIWLPQLSYYYYLTGSIFFNGYSNETRFFFNNPQILNSLFSYRKGWFLYTPIMIFAVIGLIPMFKQSKKTFWAVILVLIAMIYVNSSWYSWWFGGGFGLRAYVDIYGLLGIPLAFFLKYIWSRYLLTKVSAVLLILVVTFFNMFQSFQFVYGSIHWSDMTKEAYWYSFGRLYPGIRLPALLEAHDIELTKQGIYPEIPYKKKTTEEWKQFIISRFKTDTLMMDFFLKKSIETNKKIDTVLYYDAQWFLEQDRSVFECLLTVDYKEEDSL